MPPDLISAACLISVPSQWHPPITHVVSGHLSCGRGRASLHAWSRSRRREKDSNRAYLSRNSRLLPWAWTLALRQIQTKYTKSVNIFCFCFIIEERQAFACAGCYTRSIHQHRKQGHRTRYQRNTQQTKKQKIKSQRRKEHHGSNTNTNTVLILSLK